MGAMQLLTSRSKYLFFAVLSCSLWLAWSSNVSEVGQVVSTTSVKTAKGQPANATDSSNQSVDYVWDSIRQELMLNHQTESAQVRAEIRKLLADQEKLYSILKAAGPYIYFIHKQTKAHGLPTELALIPVIESEFNPNDHSKKGATGLWQLMPGTAHELGVKVKGGYDGRKNIVASTDAALAYFRDLGHNFNGNWYLAIAAYNCGQFKIESAQRRTGSHSFWNLPLPKETRYYVPKLLAVAAIVKDPQKYGVQLPPIANKPYFTELKVKKSISLKQVAKSTGISIETLHTLNPDHKQQAIVPSKGVDSLLVPVNKVPTVKAQLGDKIVT